MLTNNSAAATETPVYRLGDERIIRLTATAAKRVGSMLTKRGFPDGVLRIAVVGGGCSGLQYKMELQSDPAHRDILVETAGIRVVIDPKSASYVSGCELDYVEALHDGGFKFRNPNAASTCSCGESFSA
jgi:iron-sulfur cluster assembly accessory protein